MEVVLVSRKLFFFFFVVRVHINDTSKIYMGLFNLPIKVMYICFYYTNLIYHLVIIC